VTKDLWTGHNSVGYRYTVNHKEYTGKGMRNYQDLRYRNVHLETNPWCTTRLRILGCRV